MHLFYIDDSGDIGFISNNSPNNVFLLAAIIIEDSNWLKTLDAIKDFRKGLYDEYGYLQGDELKAGFLIHNTEPVRKLGLSQNQRMDIFKAALQLQVDVETIQAYAVAVNKIKWDESYAKIRILFWAWRMMIQRIERYSDKHEVFCSAYPDEGDEPIIIRAFRRYRRFAPVQSAYDSDIVLSRKAERVIEDPSFRKSKESYFVQLADLNAYAAHRYLHPEEYFGQEYWEMLDSILLKEVNELRGGPPGIVVWPT